MIFTGVRNTPSLLKLRGAYTLTDMVRVQVLSVKIPGLREVSVAFGLFPAGRYTVGFGNGLSSYGFAFQVPDGSVLTFGIASGIGPKAREVGL